MNRLKKDWADLAARVQVSEVGLDVDREKLIDRYRNEEGLTQKEIGKCVGLSFSRVGYLLQFQRFVSSSDGGTRIAVNKFRAYWQQVSDPKLTKGRREIDPAYEALCFADIRKLVEAGKLPQKKHKKQKPTQAKDIRAIADVRKAAKKVYAKLRPELKRLMRLLNADRSTYAPAIMAQAAYVIDREIRELFKILAEVGQDQTEHGEPVAANAGE